MLYQYISNSWSIIALMPKSSMSQLYSPVQFCFHPSWIRLKNRSYLDFRRWSPGQSWTLTLAYRQPCVTSRRDCARPSWTSQHWLRTSVRISHLLSCPRYRSSFLEHVWCTVRGCSTYTHSSATWSLALSWRTWDNTDHTFPNLWLSTCQSSRTSSTFWSQRCRCFDGGHLAQ